MKFNNYFKSKIKNCFRKNNSISFDLFEKYLFNLVHCWTVHVSKEEYSSFLDLLYSRIIKYRKIDASGSIKEFLPNIRVKIYETKTNSEYNINTWEPWRDDELEDGSNYDYSEPENEEDKRKFKRPHIHEGYLQEQYITIYNEEMYYENEDEIFGQQQPMEIVEPVLLEDEEIIIFGYPTQYILMQFKNKIGVLVNMIDNEEIFKPYSFKMLEYKHYEK